MDDIVRTTQITDDDGRRVIVGQDLMGTMTIRTHGGETVTLDSLTLAALRRALGSQASGRPAL